MEDFESVKFALSAGATPPLRNTTMHALDNPARRAIVALLRERPLASGDIARILKRAHPGVSYHLSELLNAGLVSCQSNGARRVYRLDASKLSASIDAYLQRAMCSSASEGQP